MHYPIKKVVVIFFYPFQYCLNISKNIRKKTNLNNFVLLLNLIVLQKCLSFVRNILTRSLIS